MWKSRELTRTKLRIFSRTKTNKPVRVKIAVLMPMRFPLESRSTPPLHCTNLKIEESEEDADNWNFQWRDGLVQLLRPPYHHLFFTTLMIIL